jgi:uncharacterized protein with NRDE domain
MLAGHDNAKEAVDAFVEQVRPSDYNPAWLLVGDRTSLFALDVSSEGRPRVEELGPGVHVLENNPLGSPSAKVDHVRAMVGNAHAITGEALLDRLATVLVDHTIAAVAPAVRDTTARAGDTAGEGASETAGKTGGEGGARFERPAATLAACVHSESYGTRSSTLVRVPVETGPRPTVRVADGHPCTSPFEDATGLWDL